jgi:hypothetical protein
MSGDYIYFYDIYILHLRARSKRCPVTLSRLISASQSSLLLTDNMTQWKFHALNGYLSISALRNPTVSQGYTLSSAALHAADNFSLRASVAEQSYHSSLSMMEQIKNFAQTSLVCTQVKCIRIGKHAIFYEQTTVRHHSVLADSLMHAPF